MLGKKWWRFTVNFDKYLQSPGQVITTKPKRHVLHSSSWLVEVPTGSPGIPTKYKVRLLYTIKSYLDWPNHEAFKKAIKDKLINDPSIDIIHSIEQTRAMLKLPPDSPTTKPLTVRINLYISMLNYSTYNSDSGHHAKLLINYLADKQFGKDPGYIRPYISVHGSHGERVTLLSDAKEEDILANKEANKLVNSILGEPKEKKEPKDKKYKESMHVSDTKVTFR